MGSINEINERYRNISIDVLKGFAIYLVVLGHVIAQFYDSWADTLINQPSAMFWWKVIYTFHMPLMFFISGYLFLSNRFKISPLFKIWLHKIQPLFFPFCFMGIILFLVKGDKNSFWYLRTLSLFISVQVIYEYIRKHIKFVVISDIIYLAIIFIVVPYLEYLKQFYKVDFLLDIDHYASNWLFFAIGLMFRRYSLFEIIGKIRYFYDVCMIVSGTYIIYTIGYGAFLNRYCTIIYVLCMIMISYWIFSSPTNHTGIVNKYLQYIGRHSLEIYVLSAFTLFKIPVIGDFIIDYCNRGFTDVRYLITGLTVEITIALILSSIVIVLCSIIFETLKSFPLIYKLFLGRTIGK